MLRPECLGPGLKFDRVSHRFIVFIPDSGDGDRIVNIKPAGAHEFAGALITLAEWVGMGFPGHFSHWQSLSSIRTHV